MGQSKLCRMNIVKKQCKVGSEQESEENLLANRFFCGLEGFFCGGWGTEGGAAGVEIFVC